MELSRLREVFDYDPLTGKIIWKRTLSPNALAGTEAGCICKDGYRTIGLDNKVVKAHIVAWILYYGFKPKSILDHKDGIRDNNAIWNLRPATTITNAYNQKTARNNTSGYKGISWCNTRNKWRAMCSVEGKRKNLGYFSDLEEAIKVLRQFREKYHGEYVNHGF